MWHYNRLTNRYEDLDAADGTAATKIPDEFAKQERGNPMAEHDAKHGHPRDWPRLPSAWKVERLMPSWPLTDERIERRRRDGYYTDAYREAIRAAARKRAAAAKEREERDK